MQVTSDIVRGWILDYLPEKMATPAAILMLLAIGKHESGFVHRKQVSGPARGFWQFEVNGVKAILRHKASAGYVREVLNEAGIEPVAGVAQAALIEPDNDAVACCLARLLLWTDPKALPARGDTEGAWRYYLRTWNPGARSAAVRERWARSYGWAMEQTK